MEWKFQVMLLIRVFPRRSAFLQELEFLGSGVVLVDVEECGVCFGNKTQK